MRLAGILLAVAALLLAACGGSDFSGTYSGTYRGQPTTVTLEQDGEKLTGTVRWAGSDSTVEAEVDGETASGSVRNGFTGLTLPFEARLAGNRIEWTYTVKNLFTGQTERVSITLRRSGAATAPAAETGGGRRDPRLVGRWRRTASGNTGVGPGRPVVATDIYCTLSADGTFEYGGAITAVSSPGWSGLAGPAQSTRGQWKTDGQTLFSKAQGTTAWIPVGRYSVSGSGLVVYPPGGKAQYWERQ